MHAMSGSVCRQIELLTKCGMCHAEALLQALQLPETENKVFALTSTEGEGPGTDKAKWKALFQTS